MELRGQELVDLVLELTPNWHKDFRRLFELADPTTAFPIRIATSEPVPAWETSAITLLGDAIHTMTPGQGVGANTALRDAMLLSRALTSVRADRGDLLPAIAGYEAEMIPYGFARVADSLPGLGHRTAGAVPGRRVAERQFLGTADAAAVPAGLRCLSYDRRGHGKSDWAGHGYDYDSLSEDLAAFLSASAPAR
jgi:2-polyprenyl-6-methoxyphenol hydroxylase-like FAD-dependent oxidoreductase